MERCKHGFGGDGKWVGVWEVVLKRYTCREVKKAGWGRGRHWDALEWQSGLSSPYRALRSVMALRSFPKWSKGGRLVFLHQSFGFGRSPEGIPLGVAVPQSLRWYPERWAAVSLQQPYSHPGGWGRGVLALKEGSDQRTMVSIMYSQVIVLSDIKIWTTRKLRENKRVQS